MSKLPMQMNAILSILKFQTNRTLKGAVKHRNFLMIEKGKRAT